MPPPYRVGILTVSDTSSRDPSTDLTGPALAELFSDPAYQQPVVRSAVPDEIPAIQAALNQWAAVGVNLAITTGGTGFSARDVTPEAVRPLLAREATGLQHLLLATSLTKTPMAALSRPVCGVTKEGMVIATVPGSPKGAKENVQALLGIVQHALDLASGGSGKVVHNSMGMPDRLSNITSQNGIAGLSTLSTPHHHHHGHHHDHSSGSTTHTHAHSHAHSHHVPKPRTMQSADLSKGASARHRVSPYPIISMKEAFASIFANTPVLGTHIRPVTDELLGYVIAEDIVAPSNLPQAATTNVDGYAIASTSTPAGVYPVITSATYPGLTDTTPVGQAAATILNTSLPDGAIYRINTGAPLPLGTDSVIMVEDTELVQSDRATGEELQVRLLAGVDRGENVRQPGSDVKAGETVLEKWTRISEIGGEIGTLAFVGKKDVSVYDKPVVAIMSTGNELTGLHAPGTPSDALTVIYDSNRPSLSLMLRSHGYKVVDLGIVPDTALATAEALRLGSQKADMVIATGGTSMGEADMLKPVIERDLQGSVIFGRVAMKPGKPTTFATFPSASRIDAPPTLVFALPGNPASALVTFHLFVLPCLHKMSGFPILDEPTQRGWHLPRVRVRVTSDMRLDPRPEFHRVWIEPDRDTQFGGCGLIARSTGGQRSSRTVSLASANGLICLPSSKEPGAQDVKKGDVVEAILMGRLGC